MSTNPKPAYRRILLKLSGEALMGDEGFGIDPKVLDRMALEIKELVELGIQVGLVIGGGNLFRGEGLAKAGMNRVVGDHMGMLATVMNGLAMRDALHRNFVNARLMSAIELNGVCDSYNWADAISNLKAGKVVIFSAGTGNPFFTTDSAACLRGIEIEAEAVLKGTKVDGVFTADPVKDPAATLYSELDYAEVLDKELKVMDLAAFTLARDHNLPIRVFNMNKPGSLKNVVMGADEGTTICHVSNKTETE
ncbi:uridylate kinase [Agarivorans sp. OAG1]|jgi:uridylate kinase|nr:MULTISPECIES: UMP kinase [Agarivorans]MPW27413.1 UMP kinase [Agarivorans sp. B2Z047]UQN44744.1 UMP kinase [Agarivorans sp. B2Z047]BEU03866.1 uridylate kinase [Agarivorans sp. OAG1]